MTTSRPGFVAAATDFFRTMMTFPRPWVVWVMVLMTVNMVIPMFYLQTAEGRVVLGAAMLGAILQIRIFSARGFVRLLGVGHFPWVLMVPWLLSRLVSTPEPGVFRIWLGATVALVSISLFIDAVDVIRYLRGEREPQLQTPA